MQSHSMSFGIKDYFESKAITENQMGKKKVSRRKEHTFPFSKEN